MRDAADRSIRRGEPVSPRLRLLPFIFELSDENGLHARPAAKIVRCLDGLDAHVTVEANGKSAAADRLVELMALGAVRGTRLLVSADGREAGKALAAVRDVLEREL